jgi:hypothetical protein
MIRRAAEVEAGAALDIEFADAHISAHADANPRKAEGEAAPRSRRRDEKQGRLL